MCPLHNIAVFRQLPPETQQLQLETYSKRFVNSTVDLCSTTLFAVKKSCILAYLLYKSGSLLWGGPSGVHNLTNHTAHTRGGPLRRAHGADRMWHLFLRVAVRVIADICFYYSVEQATMLAPV